jgi:hypothetical protein
MHLLVTAPFLGSDSRCGRVDRLWPERHCLSLQWHSRILQSAHTAYGVIIITAFTCCHVVRKTAYPNALILFAVQSLCVWFSKQYRSFSPPDRYANITTQCSSQTALSSHTGVLVARYGLVLNLYFCINSDCERLWRIYRRPVATGTRVLSKVSPRVVCGEQRAIWTGYPSQYFHFPPTAPFRQHSMLIFIYRRTNGRSLGMLLKATFFRKPGRGGGHCAERDFRFLIETVTHTDGKVTHSLTQSLTVAARMAHQDS